MAGARMMIVAVAMATVCGVMLFTAGASTVGSSPSSTSLKVTGYTSVHGRIERSSSLASSTSTPLVAAPPPSTPAWNTSLLCKHLANITSLHRSEIPPTEESIETKCLPGFACVNGYCTGGMSCKCFDGWAGLFCQDSCPKNCTPEGACVTSTSNLAICVCNETSVYVPDVGCVQKEIDDTPTTTGAPTTVDPTLRDLTERECFGSFVCIHGYCDLGSMQCLCDVGWKGQLCHERCDLKCGAHGRCRDNNEFGMFCVCDTGYAGSSCQTSLLENVTTPIPSNTTRQEVHDMGANSMWFSEDLTTPSALNVTGATQRSSGTVTLRPLSERQCLPGFVCEYGQCEKGAQTIACICDPGYGGPFCNVACGLDCGLNGTCTVGSDDRLSCRCDPGYMGVACNLTEEELTTQTSIKVGDIENAVHPAKTLSGASNKRRFDVANIEDPWTMLPEYGALLPLELRACSPGFVCRYGNCSMEEDTLKCVCQKHFIDAFCSEPCTLDCGEHGKCELNGTNKTMECYCVDTGFTGLNCSGSRPLEASALSPWAGVAIAAVLLAVLAILLVVIPYWLWKQRNLTMLNIVHWFQPFEEDDGRDYDAFVSYASADLDRQFVIQTLVPRLEGRMCYTLCIHQRNFVAGLYITDNITGSVKKSRRTLLVISPAFVSSSWCKFEYQMALQEMLHEKHRILPIIIGDVSHLKDEMDDTLKSILNTVTWLEYPGIDASEQQLDKFWKRLALSLPKKRPGQSEPVLGKSCLVSPSSTTSDVSQEPKAPLEIRSFKHNNLRGLPFQQIIRVPAKDIDSSASSRTSKSLFSFLSGLFGRSKDDDLESQNVNSSQSPLDPYYVPRQSGAPPPKYASETENMNQSNHTDENNSKTTQNVDSPVPNTNNTITPWSRPKETENNNNISMLDNYLGDQTLGRQLAI
ncbi:unnamed protein product [Lymnaea stagnalis]|uniref:Uncharacterized protein n=1 Tax=Lymnaea stagnalis TaxID=6523 RepID=A0AAV2IF95_LYMST